MSIIVVDTDLVPGKEIVEVLGVVKVSYKFRISVTYCGRLIADVLGPVKVDVIQAEDLDKDMTAGFQQITSDERHPDVISEGTVIGLGRMKKKAEEMGADAIINLRFMTSMVMSGAAEILAYGTAVKLR